MIDYVFGTCVLFILGLIMGSFLNVVATRMGTGVGVGGRSKCDHCCTELHWYELVPVLSFLALGGKCRTCGSRLSWSHPLVELSSGLLFALAYGGFLTHGSLPRLALELVLMSSIVVIGAYDARHMIIPQIPLALFLVTAVLAPGAFSDGLMLSTEHLFAGLALFAPFYILWRASDGRWIGLGDADLAACIGFYLGLVAGFGAIVLAFGVGALYATGVLVGAALGKKYRREVPFAPFLLIGFIVAYAAVNIPAVGAVAEQALSSFLLL